MLLAGMLFNTCVGLLANIFEGFPFKYILKFEPPLSCTLSSASTVIRGTLRSISNKLDVADSGSSFKLYVNLSISTLTKGV